MKEKETFLTETQAEVLELRAEGLSQSEIAKKLETSRSNICSLEKRAKRNINRAKKTLHLAKRIRAPVSEEISVGEDILDSVERFFSKADEAEIHVSLDTPALISKVERKADEKLNGRRASKKIELSLTPEGNVIVS